MLISTIAFVVDADKGEIPFRTYFSSKQVNGYIFGLLSKITSDNQIYFELYAINKKGVNQVRKDTLPMEKFLQAINALEKDLQKINPEVKLVQRNSDKLLLGGDFNQEDIHEITDIKIESNVSSRIKKFLE